MTRPLAWVVVAVWVASMGALINRSYFQVSASNLATDLARYGTSAQWRGVYYRGEKIGFTVSQVLPAPDGFELQEDGRLQMSLLGATTAAIIRTTAKVDARFRLRSFRFSLDPGTGPLTIAGRLDGLDLTLDITSAGVTRTERRVLAEPPALMLSLARRLASEGLAAGARHEWTVFDPATLGSAPVRVEVGAREIVAGAGRPIPAFKVQLTFAGLATTAWVTDTGEVVREESPMGLVTVRESQEQAVALAVSSRMRTDMLQASAVVPAMRGRIDEPRDVRRLRLRVANADLSAPDLQGVGQRVEGDLIEIVDARSLEPGPADPDRARYLDPEPFIESDDPAIRAEAERLVRGVEGARARAERLTREVNQLVEKKPTVSLPSAREVLRTRVGDCNEHTALFVAMARALGIPSRINVGLAFVRGAFYYHAWPEVYLDESGGRGSWLPVDPTFNQFPADATHVRLARGGLDRQAAILPLIGRVRMTVEEVELQPGSTPVIVGRALADTRPLAIPLPTRQDCGCWWAPCGGRR